MCAICEICGFFNAVRDLRQNNRQSLISKNAELLFYKSLLRVGFTAEESDEGGNFTASQQNLQSAVGDNAE
jgi:hypothetical protein